MLLTALTLGSLIGLILGLTGAGGGILAVPALTLVLGFTITQASPIALLAIASAAVIGLISAFKKRLVRFRAALLVSSNGIVAAPLGQYFAQSLPEHWLTGIFSVVMLIVAYRLWQSTAAQVLSDDGIAIVKVNECKINEKTGHIVWNINSFVTLSTIGLITGLTTGLLGVGGGFIIVPALLRFSNISLPGVVATSLMVIALVSSGAFASALVTGHIDLTESASIFITGTLLGMLFARHYADNIPKQHLLSIFSGLMVVVSLVMLYKTIR